MSGFHEGRGAAAVVGVSWCSPPHGGLLGVALLGLSRCGRGRRGSGGGGACGPRGGARCGSCGRGGGERMTRSSRQSGDIVMHVYRYTDIDTHRQT